MSPIISLNTVYPPVPVKEIKDGPNSPVKLISFQFSIVLYFHSFHFYPYNSDFFPISMLHSNNYLSSFIKSAFLNSFISKTISETQHLFYSPYLFIPAYTIFIGIYYWVRFFCLMSIMRACLFYNVLKF